jgi:hypothetical protein
MPLAQDDPHCTRDARIGQVLFAGLKGKGAARPEFERKKAALKEAGRKRFVHRVEDRENV